MNVRKVLMLCMLPMCACAFFPPASKSTSGEMLEYRRRKKIEYEDDRLAYEQQAIDSRSRTVASLESLPWSMDSNVKKGAPVLSAEISKTENLSEKNSIVRIVFLVFVFVAAGLYILLKKRHIIRQLIGRE